MARHPLPNEVAIGCGWTKGVICSLLFVLPFAVGVSAERAQGSSRSAGEAVELVYTNIVVPQVPWSTHVVKIPRSGSRYEIQSRHAGSGALGLSTLGEQIFTVDSKSAEPVAAINGGFYLRDTAYAGAARGLQIVGGKGEVISLPAGQQVSPSPPSTPPHPKGQMSEGGSREGGEGHKTTTFWIDLNGEPRLTEVGSKFEVTWPDGRVTPIRLNEERGESGAVLYTPAIGASTHTVGGLELVLEKQERSRWLPLRVGRNYSARVRAVHETGNTILTLDTLVLSVGSTARKNLPPISVGAELQISTASAPSLAAARTALSAGPVLIRNGKRQKIRASAEGSYEVSSMLERHPRSAIGWNQDWFFLVVVDGRQKDLSVGMTLEELATYLAKLGCTEALNLDGGGSATLWCKGEVRNSPCDGYERPIANSLVVLRKVSKAGTTKEPTSAQIDATERSQSN